MNVRARGEKRFEFIAHVVMIVLSVFAILPFILLVSASFTDEASAVANGFRFIPEKVSMVAYEYLFAEWTQIGRSYLITIIVTLVGTILCLAITTMFSYALTVKKVPGLKLIFFLTLFSMLFRGGVVSTYYIYCNLIHIKNTIWALIVPQLLMSGFNIILIKNYITNQIPGELLEAAEIDGAGQFRIFFKIVVPLSTPILATIGLLSAVNYWNDWNNGLYYITDSNLYSIQQLLNQMNNNVQFLISNASQLGIKNTGTLPSTTMRMAIAVVAIVPIISVYPFFQKYFAKGITMGAVKG